MRQKLVAAKQLLCESRKMAEVYTLQWEMQKNIDMASSAISRVLSDLEDMTRQTQ